MGWTVEQALDVTLTTLEQLDKGMWTDISFASQDYIAARKLIKEEKITVSDGDKLRINVRFDNDGNFRWVPLGAEDIVAQGDMFTAGYVPWRHCTANWSIEKREMTINRGVSRIVDLVTGRKASMLGDFMEQFEAAFWGKPADSTDVTTMYGVFYWLKWNATTGFNGGAVAGFTGGPADISPTTYSGWNNFTGTYVAVTKPDLIALMRNAYVKTKFRNPLPASMQGGRGDNSGKYGVYVANYATLAAMETSVETQNENLGNDIASKDGVTTFRGTPIEWVPQMEGLTGAPVIGINWDDFDIVCLEGWDGAQTELERQPNQHTVLAQHMDWTLNTRMRNRRKHWLLATADPYA